MKMNNNKLKFILYVLAFCVILTGISGFYIGKNMGFDVISTSASDCSRRNEIDLVKSEINEVIDILNNKRSGDKCYSNIDIVNIDQSKYFDYFAVLMMECKYKEDYKGSLINSKEYEKFRKIFNIELEKRDSSYLINRSNYGFDGYEYRLGDVTRIGLDYNVYINIYKDSVYISKALMIVSVVNNHIYFKDFSLNQE